MIDTELMKQCQQAMVRLNAGDAETATALLDRLLHKAPSAPESLFIESALAYHVNDLAAARQKFEAAMAVGGHDPAFLPLQKLALTAAGTRGASGIYLDLAQTCQQSGRMHEAITWYRHLLELIETAELHNNIGALYQSQGNLDAAIHHFDRALSIKPDLLQAACNLGNALIDADRIDQGVSRLKLLVKEAPDFMEAHIALGYGYQCQGHFMAARSSCEAAIALNPEKAEGYNGLGMVFDEMGRLDLAEANYRRAIARDSSSAGAFNNLANVLDRLGQTSEALALYDRAIRMDPDFAEAYANALSPLLVSCEWDRVESYAARLEELQQCRPARGIFALEGPLVSLQRCDEPTRHLKIARIRAEAVSRRVPPSDNTFDFHGRRRPNGPLTIGYLSANFNRHPVAFQIGGLFRCHDRSRYRTLGYAIGPDDGSDIAKDIRKSCDGFRDLDQMGHEAAARIIYDDAVDILVDLMGHTRGNRMEIIARRPAPIIVNYLGFLASTGATFVDYLICDRIVVPPAHAPHYSEKLVHLPHSYQINDDRLNISPRRVTRQEVGLPENQFVFCSFNNPAKIDPVIFDAWMTILRQVKNSVLWLQGGNDRARQNLNRQAYRLGIDPNRLIHAPTLPLSDHLARLKHAHLALDTRLYNGGATTSNALWAGVPVITVPGGDFVSRMSASALSAMELTDLICPDVETYVKLAVDLAGDQERLAAVRRRVETHRRTTPFFDTQRFVRNLERAYGCMWKIFEEGKPPQPIRIGEE
jgi:predicted O-linked N-acetylglucosamine transferase (SPINDLY family)